MICILLMIMHILICVSRSVQKHFFWSKANSWSAALKNGDGKAPNFDRKMNQIVLSKTYKILMKLSMGGVVNGILKDIYTSHNKKLEKYSANAVIQQFKEDFLFVKNYFLMGTVSEFDQKLQWRRLSDVGTFSLPPYLSPIYHRLGELNSWDKVLLLTLLRSYKHMDIPGPHKLETIYTMMGYQTYINTYKVCMSMSCVYKWMGMPKLQPSDTGDYSKISIAKGLTPGTNTGSLLHAVGPSGNTLVSRLVDLMNVYQKPMYAGLLDLFAKFYSDFTKVGKGPGITNVSKLFQHFSKPVLDETLSMAKENSKIKPKVDMKILNRLSYFTDGAGKWRYIAISDWITQSILSPMHNLMFDALKSMSTDCTFDQNKIRAKYQEMYSQGKGAYCLDLSAATDRLPLPLQAFLMFLLTKNFGLSLSWMLIMMYNPFHLTGDMEKKFYYQTGQGMGIYTSWAMLALTNHAIVRLSGKVYGHSDFSDYLVLGDDVVIFNKEVADGYLTVMSKLGVDISQPKSIFPKENKFGCEFASRLFVEGQELSPLPVGLLIKDPNVDNILNFWTTVHWKSTELVETQYQDSLTTPDLSSAVPLSGSEDLKTIWGFMSVYNYYYTQHMKFSENEVPSGAWMSLPEASPLHTLLEAIPLKSMEEVESTMEKILYRRFSQALKTMTKHSKTFDSIKDMLVPLYGSLGDLESRFPHILSMYLFFMSPFYHCIDKFSELNLDPQSEMDSHMIAAGSGVLVMDQAQKLDHMAKFFTFAPLSMHKKIDIESLSDLLKISYGPKSLFLGKDDWILKDPLTKKVLSKKVLSRQRVSKKDVQNAIRVSTFRMAVMDQYLRSNK
ncbi:RNA-dependent RNA polymerase [Wenling narna-like virus 9]|uniref:RNA-dependent RNA polymerase n=1 Tax=Wenling narna-like virus 9 TaxID=1923509 RepID=UPI00090CD5CF|nr:RNA-dependent RNA polymerase [Wenling narna-like virus 9]APG77262.1 RNA-dependent RNA polymerase [Wenling narna-like virus 9]